MNIKAQSVQLSCREAAGLFQLLSHSARLRILDELLRNAACICHLQVVLDRPRPYISQQFHVLRDEPIRLPACPGPKCESCYEGGER